MLYVPLNVGVLNHPKFDNFMEAAGIETVAEAVGVLSCMWLWATAQEIPEDGTLPTMSARTKSKLFGCNLERVESLEVALILSGFLDQDGDTLRIHSWPDYGGKLMAERSRRAEYARRKREEKERDGNVTERDPDVTVTSPSKGEPSQAKPSLGEPSKGTHSPRKRGVSVSEDYPPDFETFWLEYPKQHGKGDAATVWAGLTPEQRVKATTGAKALGLLWRGTDKTYCPHASTWLAGRRFDDPQQEGPKREADDKPLPGNIMPPPRPIIEPPWVAWWDGLTKEQRLESLNAAWTNYEPNCKRFQTIAGTTGKALWGDGPHGEGKFAESAYRKR